MSRTTSSSSLRVPFLLAVFSGALYAGFAKRLRDRAAPVIAARDSTAAVVATLSHMSVGEANQVRDRARMARQVIATAERRMHTDEDVGSLMRQVQDACVRYHLSVDTLQPDSSAVIFTGLAPYGVAPYRIGISGRWEDLIALLHSWSTADTMAIPYVRMLAIDSTAAVTGSDRMDAQLIVGLITRQPTRMVTTATSASPGLFMPATSAPTAATMQQSGS